MKSTCLLLLSVFSAHSVMSCSSSTGEPGGARVRTMEPVARMVRAVPPRMAEPLLRTAATNKEAVGSRALAGGKEPAPPEHQGQPGCGRPADLGREDQVAFRRALVVTVP